MHTVEVKNPKATTQHNAKNRPGIIPIASKWDSFPLNRLSGLIVPVPWALNLFPSVIEKVIRVEKILQDKCFICAG